MTSHVSKIVLFLALTMVGQSTAFADPILRISDLPTTYTPGDTINFNVDLIGDGTTALSAYGIPLIVSSLTGTAGTDFYFSPATEGPGNIFPGVPPAPGQSPFLPGIPGTAPGNSATLTFSDGLAIIPVISEPVTVGNAVVQTLALLSLNTLVGSVGNLTLGFDTGVQLLDGTPPVPGPGPLPAPFTLEITDTTGAVHSGTIVAATGAVPVPEPASFGMLLTGALCLGGLALRRRRTPSAA